MIIAVSKETSMYLNAWRCLVFMVIVLHTPSANYTYINLHVLLCWKPYSTYTRTVQPTCAHACTVQVLACTALAREFAFALCVCVCVCVYHNKVLFTTTLHAWCTQKSWSCKECFVSTIDIIDYVDYNIYVSTIHTWWRSADDHTPQRNHKLWQHGLVYYGMPYELYGSREFMAYPTHALHTNIPYSRKFLRVLVFSWIGVKPRNSLPELLTNGSYHIRI